MLNKSTEERGYDSKFIAYLVDSECNVQLPTIESPEREWQSVKTLFDKVCEIEKTVTKSINNINTIPENEGCRTATAMLDLF